MKWAGIIEDLPEAGFHEVEAETENDAELLIRAAFHAEGLSDRQLDDGLIVLSHASQFGGQE